MCLTDFTTADSLSLSQAIRDGIETITCLVLLWLTVCYQGRVFSPAQFIKVKMTVCNPSNWQCENRNHWVHLIVNRLFLYFTLFFTNYLISSRYLTWSGVTHSLPSILTTHAWLQTTSESSECSALWIKWIQSPSGMNISDMQYVWLGWSMSCPCARRWRLMWADWGSFWTTPMLSACTWKVTSSLWRKSWSAWGRTMRWWGTLSRNEPALLFHSWPRLPVKTCQVLVLVDRQVYKTLCCQTGLNY